MKNKRLMKLLTQYAIWSFIPVVAKAISHRMMGLIQSTEDAVAIYQNCKELPRKDRETIKTLLVTGRDALTYEFRLELFKEYADPCLLEMDSYPTNVEAFDFCLYAATTPNVGRKFREKAYTAIVDLMGNDYLKIYKVYQVRKALGVREVLLENSGNLVDCISSFELTHDPRFLEKALQQYCQTIQDFAEIEKVIPVTDKISQRLLREEVQRYLDLFKVSL
jgi:hypothetical protein